LAPTSGVGEGGSEEYRGSSGPRQANRASHGESYSPQECVMAKETAGKRFKWAQKDRACGFWSWTGKEAGAPGARPLPRGRGSAAITKSGGGEKKSFRIRPGNILRKTVVRGGEGGGLGGGPKKRNKSLKKGTWRNCANGNREATDSRGLVPKRKSEEEVNCERRLSRTQK